MIHLSANVDISKPLEFLRTVKSETIYAASRTCNLVALKVQDFTTATLLPSKFVLRAKGTPWYKPGQRFGFNAKFATRQNLVASVGSRADWLDLQERGGVKKISGKRLAIPSTAWKPTAEIMAAAKKPRAIFDGNFIGPLPQKADRKLKRARAAGQKQLTQYGLLAPFVLNGRDGKPIGIYAHKPNQTEPQILFRFQEDAQQKPILEFQVNGKKIIDQNFSRDFAFEFAKAMATAKQS